MSTGGTGTRLQGGSGPGHSEAWEPPLPRDLALSLEWTRTPRHPKPWKPLCPGTWLCVWSGPGRPEPWELPLPETL